MIGCVCARRGNEMSVAATWWPGHLLADLLYNLGWGSVTSPVAIR